jgi:hypothetical protein
MESRYDYMLSSGVQDEDGETYPDVLSCNYVNGALTKIPTAYVIDETDLGKFWLTMWKVYKCVDKDDIWLNINGIPYLGLLEPGSTLYIPVVEDLKGFLLNKTVGNSDDEPAHY